MTPPTPKPPGAVCTGCDAGMVTGAIGAFTVAINGPTAPALTLGTNSVTVNATGPIKALSLTISCLTKQGARRCGAINPALGADSRLWVRAGPRLMEWEPICSI